MNSLFFSSGSNPHWSISYVKNKTTCRIKRSWLHLQNNKVVSHMDRPAQNLSSSDDLHGGVEHHLSAGWSGCRARHCWCGHWGGLRSRTSSGVRWGQVWDWKLRSLGTVTRGREAILVYVCVYIYIRVLCLVDRVLFIPYHVLRWRMLIYLFYPFKKNASVVSWNWHFKMYYM